MGARLRHLGWRASISLPRNCHLTQLLALPFAAFLLPAHISVCFSPQRQYYADLEHKQVFLFFSNVEWEGSDLNLVGAGSSPLSSGRRLLASAFSAFSLETLKFNFKPKIQAWCWAALGRLNGWAAKQQLGGICHTRQLVTSTWALAPLYHCTRSGPTPAPLV